VIERVDAGDAVVLVGPDATEVGDGVREALTRGERVGAVVGSPDDTDVRAAIAEMLAELYATAPTIL
jgi:hypothetical protein